MSTSACQWRSNFGRVQRTRNKISRPIKQKKRIGISGKNAARPAVPEEADRWKTISVGRKAASGRVYVCVSVTDLGERGRLRADLFLFQSTPGSSFPTCLNSKAAHAWKLNAYANDYNWSFILMRLLRYFQGTVCWLC